MSAMAMTAVAVKSVWRAAEAAIGRPAIGPAVRTGHGHVSGAAIPSRHKTHRDGANRGAPHQCQHDAARSFHGGGPSLKVRWYQAVSVTRWRRGKQIARVSRQRAGRCQPPEKCDANECANEPKPPRVTPLEPESDDVDDDEWLDEESPEKKLLREDDPPPPPDEELRGLQSVFACGNAGAAIPGDVGWQLSPGISA